MVRRNLIPLALSLVVPPGTSSRTVRGRWYWQPTRIALPVVLRSGTVPSILPQMAMPLVPTQFPWVALAPPRSNIDRKNATVARPSRSTRRRAVVYLGCQYSGNSLNYSGNITLNGDLTARSFSLVQTLALATQPFRERSRAPEPHLEQYRYDNRWIQLDIVVSNTVNHVGAITSRGDNAGELYNHD